MPPARPVALWQPTQYVSSMLRIGEERSMGGAVVWVCAEGCAVAKAKARTMRVRRFMEINRSFHHKPRYFVYPNHGRQRLSRVRRFPLLSEEGWTRHHPSRP